MKTPDAVWIEESGTEAVHSQPHGSEPPLNTGSHMHVIVTLTGSFALGWKEASRPMKGGCMTLARWSLARGLIAVCDAIGWLCNACTRPAMSQGEMWPSGAWSPAVDLYETDDAFILKAELAGFAEEDLNLEIKERALRLRGSRLRAREVNEDLYHCMEWASGTFQRCFLLPAIVDQENVSTSYKDGVFTLRLPKAGSTSLGHHQHEVSRQSS
jgi:HSP20 family protein